MDKLQAPNKETASSDTEMLDKENSNSPSDSLIGEVVDEKYQIIEVIGAGGMGRVYKAKQLLMNEIVAIKILSKELTKQPQAMKRFAREAQAASRIDHINVVAVRGFGICNKNEVAYLAMPNLTGESLKKILSKDGKLNIERCLKLFIQICAGLSEAHHKEVVHRDMKPSNVLLIQHNNDKDAVKIIDFGIAQVSTADGTTILETLTATQEMIGTPSYMSPEQVSGKEVDRRSDIYSVGCMLFETLTGEVPFKAEKLATVCVMHMTAQPPHLVMKDADPILVQRLDAIIQKCLAKEPPMRYQNIDDLQSDLELVQFRLDQLKSEKTNKILLAIEKAWLLSSQFVRKTNAKLFSVRLSSSGLTVGSVTVIVFIVLALIAIPGVLFLFGPSFNANLSERELPLQPIIDSSIKPPEPASGESLWHKLQSPAARSSENLEYALKAFMHIADLNYKTGNYEMACWWYYRAEAVAEWLKLGSSALSADLRLSFAESCLMINTSVDMQEQSRNREIISRTRGFSKFVNPEIFRQDGLIFAANAASARDCSLGALDIIKNLNIKQSPQILLGYGLLAESFLQLGDIDEAKRNYDKLYALLTTDSLSAEADKSKCAFVITSAGRFYLRQGESTKTQALLRRSETYFTELGKSAQYSLAAIYNDLGLLKEANGEPVKAEAFFRQADAALSASDKNISKCRTVLINNMADAAFKAGDYRSAILYRLQGTTKLAI